MSLSICQQTLPCGTMLPCKYFGPFYSLHFLRVQVRVLKGHFVLEMHCLTHLCTSTNHVIQNYINWIYLPRLQIGIHVVSVYLWQMNFWALSCELMRNVEHNSPKEPLDSVILSSLFILLPSTNLHTTQPDLPTACCLLITLGWSQPGTSTSLQKR